MKKLTIMKKEAQSAKRAFHAALLGSVVVAVCCFTPVLVVVFAAVGLSTFTPYLDYVLYPALAILLVLAIVSYRKWKALSSAE